MLNLSYRIVELESLIISIVVGFFSRWTRLYFFWSNKYFKFWYSFSIVFFCFSNSSFCCWSSIFLFDNADISSSWAFTAQVFSCNKVLSLFSSSFLCDTTSLNCPSRISIFCCLSTGDPSQKAVGGRLSLLWWPRWPLSREQFFFEQWIYSAMPASTKCSERQSKLSSIISIG